jgi:heme exporter protein A
LRFASIAVDSAFATAPRAKPEDDSVEVWREGWAVILTATALACDRGGRRVFDNLSFSLNDGEYLELRGANGTGKSSLLRLLAGFDAPAEGTLTQATEAIYIGHADAIKPSLTVTENLEFWRDCFASCDVTQALATFNLQSLANDSVSLLSQGQKRRVALSRLALIGRPLWLLDEPTVGLDAASLIILRTLMTKHLASGGAIIAATHQDMGLKPAATITLQERA